MSGVKGRSGRKPTDPTGTHRVYRSMRLAPDTDRTITANKQGKDSYAATIDRIVREWLASQS